MVVCVARSDHNDNVIAAPNPTGDAPMLNIGRRDVSLPPRNFKEPEKPLARPQQTSAPIASPAIAQQVTTGGTRPITSNAAAPVLRDSVAMPPTPEPPRKDLEAQTPAIGPDTPGSKL